MKLQLARFFISKEKKKIKKMKMDYRSLFQLLTILAFITPSLQNPACLVDQCKHCRYHDVDLCDECEDGYYRRTFYGSDKGRNYNACWSTIKLIWGIIGFILLLLSYCVCFYFAWKHGQDSVKSIVNHQRDEHLDTDMPQSTDRRHFNRNHDKERSYREDPRMDSIPKRERPAYIDGNRSPAAMSPAAYDEGRRYKSPYRSPYREGSIRDLPR